MNMQKLLQHYTVNPEHIWLQVNSHPISGGFEPHAHQFYELIVVLNGSAIHVCNHHRCRIGSGDFLLVEPEMEHEFHIRDSISVLNILFLPGVLEHLSRELAGAPLFSTLIEPGNSGKVYHLAEQHLIHVLRHGDKAMEEQCKALPGYRLAVESCFYELLLLLCRHGVTAEERAPRFFPEQIRVLVEYMEQHFRDGLTMRHFLTVAQMSESSLLRHFRMHTGETPARYLMKLRLESGAKLLSSTELSVSAIAYQSGFQDGNYFSHQFRKHYRLSPREYRQKSRSANFYVNDVKGYQGPPRGEMPECHRTPKTQ